MFPQREGHREGGSRPSPPEKKVKSTPTKPKGSLLLQYGSWYVRFYQDGKRKPLRIAPEGTDQKKVRQLAATLMLEVNSGKVESIDARRPEVMVFDFWAGTFLPWATQPLLRDGRHGNASPDRSGNVSIRETAVLESEAIMKRTAHLLALLVLLSTGSAQHVEPWSATRPLRMKEASRLHEKLSAMYKQVPELSPAEQKWLEGELNSGNGKITERYVRATESQEYDISTAKSGLAAVVIPLNKLSSLKLTCKDEVVQWAEVASRLEDSQLWYSVDSLVKRKIISTKSADDFGHSFLAANATMRSQAILDGVVIPYLRGELGCQ